MFNSEIMKSPDSLTDRRTQPFIVNKDDNKNYSSDEEEDDQEPEEKQVGLEEEEGEVAAGQDGDDQGDQGDLGEDEEDDEEEHDDNVKTENPINEGEKKQNGWQVHKNNTWSSRKLDDQV